VKEGNMPSLEKLEFKVLLLQECDHDLVPIYIAQCLNYDLVAQGETISDVLNSLKRVIKTQIAVSLNNGIRPFSDFGPAPAELWKQYDSIPDREATAFAFTFATDIEPGDLDAKTRSVSAIGLTKLPV